MTPEPTRPFDTESRDTVFVEFEVQLDEWKPLTPEEARELRRRLPPPWNRALPPQADSHPPAE